MRDNTEKVEWLRRHTEFANKALQYESKRAYMDEYELGELYAAYYALKQAEYRVYGNRNR